jgi:hypothetical protein
MEPLSRTSHVVGTARLQHAATRKTNLLLQNAHQMHGTVSRDHNRERITRSDKIASFFLKVTRFSRIMFCLARTMKAQALWFGLGDSCYQAVCIYRRGLACGTAVDISGWPNFGGSPRLSPSPQ